MQDKIMQYAIEKAKQIPYKRKQSRHYCVITDKRGRIVSEAANSFVRTHTIMHKVSRKLGLEKDFLHSEIGAIINDKVKKGYKLTVVRIDSEGNPASSMPCPVCMSVIKEASWIKSITWS